MKKTNIILTVIIILVIALGLYLYLNKSNPSSDINNQPNNQNQVGTQTSEIPGETLVKDDSPANNEPDASSENPHHSEDLNIPEGERVPSLYACVGEYCDGSMSGNPEKYTVITLPFIKEGGNIGCGVSVFYSKDTVPKTTAVLDATYKRLFDIKEWPEIKEDGFHNTVAAFTYLYYDHVTLQDGVAKLYLVGHTTSPGVCAEPELRAQIEAVAFEFASVDKLEVYLNNELFDWCLLDASGGASSCPEQPKYWVTERTN